MFIDVEATPNPLTMKFVPHEEVLKDNNTLEIDNEEKAKVSPLAQDLFKIDGIKKVFLGSDFISVTIDKKDNWTHLRTSIVSVISDYFVKGLEIVKENSSLEGVNDKFNVDSLNEDEKKIAEEINEIIEERIRPSIAMDGGDILFKGYSKGKVYLQLLGACSGCPSSKITLKNGIENMLKYFVPEIEEVLEIEAS